MDEKISQQSTVTIEMSKEMVSTANTKVEEEQVPSREQEEALKSQGGVPNSSPNTPTEEKISKEKPKLGRPCEFCKRPEEILKIVTDYLEPRLNIDKPKMPFIGEVAILLDCDDETIQLWAEKEKEDGSLEHPAFSAVIKKLKNTQHLRLQQRLLGRYNPTGSIMWLKTKFGYIETEKRILAGDKNNKLEVILTEERKIPEND